MNAFIPAARRSKIGPAPLLTYSPTPAPLSKNPPTWEELLQNNATKGALVLADYVALFDEARKDAPPQLLLSSLLIAPRSFDHASSLT